MQGCNGVETNSTAVEAAVRCCGEAEEELEPAKKKGRRGKKEEIPARRLKSWTCTTPEDCPKRKKYEEAEEICKKLDMKICTKAQITSAICCGTGCNFNTKAVWIRSFNQKN